MAPNRKPWKKILTILNKIIFVAKTPWKGQEKNTLRTYLQQKSETNS